MNDNNTILQVNATLIAGILIFVPYYFKFSIIHLLQTHRWHYKGEERKKISILIQAILLLLYHIPHL